MLRPALLGLAALALVVLGLWATRGADDVEEAEGPRGGPSEQVPATVRLRGPGSSDPAASSEAKEHRVDAAIPRPAGLAVRGVVVPPPGVPLSAVRLWEGAPSENPVDLDAYGAFGWEGVAEGAEIAVQAAALHEGVRYAARGRVVAGRDDFTLTWTGVRGGDRALLRVRFRDGSGTPVGALLHWGTQVGSESSWSSVRRGFGEVLLEFVYQPALRLHLVAEPLTGVGLGPAVRESLPAEETTVDLVFPAERTLAGRVEGADAGPVTGLDVSLALRLARRPGAPETALETRTTPDRFGAFQFRGLGPYEYVLLVVDGAGRPLAERIVGPAEADLDIVVEPAVKARIEVKDPDGQPVVGAVATASIPPAGVPLDFRATPLDPDVFPFRSVASGIAGPEGEVILSGLDPTRLYRLVVEGPVGRQDLLPFAWQGWPPEATGIRLQRAYAISGRVLDAAGRPVADQRVHARGVNMRYGGARLLRTSVQGGTRWEIPSARTSRDGSFRIHPVPEGTWRLHVPGIRGSDVEAQAGATDILLTTPEDRTQPQVRLQLHVLYLEPADRGTMVFFGDAHRRLDEEGHVTFTDVIAGTEAPVWIAGLSGGRYVWEKAVRASREVVVLRPLRGGAIRGRVRAPGGARLDALSLWPRGPLGVWVEDDPAAGNFRWTADTRTGTFEVVGVPPGTWRIRVWGRRGEQRLTGEVAAGPGEEVVVELR